MKKSEKWIYIILGFVLVGVLASGITYLVMNNSNKKQEESTKVNETDKKDEENKPVQKIELTEKELEDYLDYVPSISFSGLINAYQMKKITVDDVNINVFRDLAIRMEAIEEDCYGETKCLEGDFAPEKDVCSTCYHSLESINEKMHKMYNCEVTNPKNGTSEKDIFQVMGNSVVYQNGYFITLPGAGNTFGGWHLSNIDSYTANIEEIVIYEYAAFSYSPDSVEGKPEYWKTDIKDAYTGYSITVEAKYDGFSELVEKNFEEHKTEVTKYKHIFKKNDTGYYWYSSEVA